jgi:molecular chaperone Hsp33
VKCISTNGNLRGVGIECTQVVQELIQIHQLTPKGGRFLAEAVVGSFMLGSYCKAGERVNLNIQGSGHCSQVLVETYPDGRFRGYAIERSQPLMSIPGQGPWGGGTLSVLRAKASSGVQPWIGTVPLVTGHLAKDLTYYWSQSEQVPSAIGILVRQDSSGRVLLAAGFLVQAMPGATFEEIAMIEQHLHDFNASEAENSGEGMEPMQVLGRVFQSTPFIKLEETPLQFECSCSRERVENAMLLVGADELRTMLAEDRGASVNCDFCSTEYRFDAAHLEVLIEEAIRRSGAPEGQS